MTLHALPELPLPPDTVEQRLVASDGVAIRAARWPARVRPALGTVCLFQGRGEQIEKYFPVVETLRDRGFAVATFDWRGQGGSDRLGRKRELGHVADFRHYTRDIEVFRRQMVLPDCPGPYFALAHSMGGNIVLGAAPKLAPWFRRIVLSAPFLDFGSVPFRRSTVRRLAMAMRLIGLGRSSIPGPTRKLAVVREFDGNPLTSDPEQFRIMTALTRIYPELWLGPPTNGWIHAAAVAMDRLEAEDFPDRIQIPIMIVNCGADTLVSVDANERMARRLRSVAYVLVPGARHEIMFEAPVYADQFWAAFDSFVPGSKD
ncbi:alpha/beta fold hydrolase [Chthonobacter rhizosphaerae]|uniref:alpha/beta fold hydrolase n=1 Tax=Chthonobacter rhizosphaerae TaxID=2735553 RepID=UPI0015EEFD2D|nr:alpha/beta hydrolase [Chthonobacter rhizosphaerae]